MPINWELSPTILLAIIVQVVLLIVGYIRTTDKSSNAIKVAESAQLSVSALNASFSLFQVQVARDYVSREVLNQFENRLTVSAKENVERLAREISELREVIIGTRLGKRRDGHAE